MARLFVTDINLNKNELQNARIQNLSTAPSAPVTGQVYYNTTDNILYFWNGTAFISTSGSLEVIQDAIDSTIVAGVGLDKTYNDGGNTYTLDIDSTVATLTGTQTLTNKSISLATNTVTSTLAQLNTAITDADVASLAGAETLTNKTLTSPVVTGLDATTTTKGLASFATADFTVASGAVTIKNVDLATQTTGNYIATIAGTANEVEISGSGSENSAVTIGLPSDVTITNNLTVGGNLTVTGTIDSVNTTQVNIVDNKINLNTGFTGSPTADAGIRVERGSSADVEVLWNETSDTWTLSNDGTNYHAIVRKFSSNITTAVSTPFTFVATHNLNSRDVVVQVYDNSSPYAQVEVDVDHTTVNTATLTFATQPTAGAYRVVVTG